MTATATPSPSPELDVPAPQRKGSLVRAEVRRFGARRFIRVLLAVGLLGWLLAVVIGLSTHGHPDASDLAAARHQQQEAVTQSNQGRQQCLDDPSRPSNVSPEEACGPPITAADIPIDSFVSNPPFDFVASAENGAMGFAAAAAVLAFLIGATWIGAEWSSRSIVALLFWQPRRYRVMGAKLTVLVVAAALLGVLAQAAWLAMAGIVSAVAGDSSAQPAHFWSHLLATQSRGVLLTALAALAGFGLANVIRNTAAALGVGFVYFAVAETAVRALRPTWQPFLLTNNAVGLLLPRGLTVYTPNGSVDPGGGPGMREYVVTHLQASILLTAVTVVVVAVGVLLFARRDVH